MTRRFPLVLLLALLLAACGEKEEPGGGGAAAARAEPFRVVLDWMPNADHAGLFAAQEGGEFRRAGLDVDFQRPPDPAAPLKLLQAGKADLAISYEPDLLLARDKGADLVAVGALVQKPLTALISLPKARVRRLADLRGKRIGTSGLAYQTAYVRTILRDAGVDPASVKVTNVGFNLVAAMVSGRVAATLGAFWNVEGTELQRDGRRPEIRRMEQLGVPTYNELVLVARRADLDRAGASRVRRFMQAAARGHALLRTEPDTALDGLLAADDGLDRELQADIVRTTLPVFFPRDADKPFGWQEPTEWDAYADWMRANRLITRPDRGSRALTNEFLPGEGLDPGTVTQE